MLVTSGAITSMTSFSGSEPVITQLKMLVISALDVLSSEASAA